MRAVVYCRFSREDTNNSLERQEATCLRFAQGKRWEVIGIYKEDMSSGYDFDLPEMKNVITLAKGRAFDKLVVSTADRLARNKLKAQLLQLELSNYDIEIAYADRDIEDPEIAGIVSELDHMVAERERKTIAKRTSGGRNDMVQRGSVMFHNYPPLGYDSQKIDGRWRVIPIPEELRIVKLVFDLFTNGRTLNSIAEQFNREEVPTYSELRDKRQTKNVWYPAQIRNILRNRLYVGTFIYSKRKLAHKMNFHNGVITTKKVWLENDSPIEVEVPEAKVIDQRIFDKAQKLLSQNKSYGRKPKGKFLLSQRVYCECGLKGGAETRLVKGKRYGYYSVQHCEKVKMFNSQKVDDFVWDWLRGIVLDREGFRKRIEDYANETEKMLEPLNQKIKGLKALRAKKVEQYEPILRNWMSLDNFDKGILKSQKLELQADIKELDTQIAVAEQERDNFADIGTIDWLLDGRDWVRYWDGVANTFEFLDAPFEQKLDYIRRYDVTLKILRIEGEYWFKLKCNFAEDLLKFNNIFRNVLQLQHILDFTELLKVDFS